MSQPTHFAAPQTAAAVNPVAAIAFAAVFIDVASSAAFTQHGA